MRGQKKRKNNKDGKRLKQKKALIAVIIAWKLLDQVSSWTSFSFSLSLQQLHYEALTANIPQASVPTPTERQTPISKQRIIMEYLIIPTREQNIYLEFLYFKEAAEFVFHPSVGPRSTPSPQGEAPPPSSILLFFIMHPLH